MAQTVKRLPTMRETWVQSVDQEDILEKEMATHSSILAWKIPWMEEPGRLQPMGLQRVGHDGATNTFTRFRSPFFLTDFHFTYLFSWQSPLIPCKAGEWASQVAQC